MTEPIIDTELPESMKREMSLCDMDLREFELFKRLFIAAQRQAIMRFVSAVEQRAHTIESSYVTSYAWRDALWEVRVDLAAKEEV